MHVLWLASWYPDEIAPTNGDFVQRHARAVEELHPITVIHVQQGDPAKPHLRKMTMTTTSGNLREIIIHFPYQPTGYRLLDKLRYHHWYRKALFGAIDQYVREHGVPDLVHLHVPVKAGIGALYLRDRYHVPFMVSEQSSEYVRDAPNNYWSRSARYRKLVARLFREAVVVTNVSRTMGEVLKQISGRAEVIQVPNTVDTSLFRYTGEQPRRFRFIHVSNLNEQKNISGLLRVFAKLVAERTDWELVLVGPAGPHLDPLLRPIRGKVKVTCTGLLHYADVAEEMRRSSAFVLFSDHENFPCVIVEALCCGLPVITSTAGGSGDAIDPSNGETVAPRDEEALLASLRRMCEGVKTYDRPAIAREAAARYSYDVVGKRFLEIYQDVLKERISS